MISPAAEAAQRILDTDGREALAREEGLALADERRTDFSDLLYWADQLRRRFCGNRVSCCSIVSVKTGACSEDCAFCAQAAKHHAQIKPHPFLPVEDVRRAARESARNGSATLGLVASGRGPKDADLPRYEEYLRALKEEGVEGHVGIGVLTEEQIRRLRDAGMARCCHNLETSRRFFPNVCTTHAFDERLDTLRRLRAAGVSICSGGIFGLGETWDDRVDLALTLREIEPDNVPLNFLHPIPGTPAANFRPLPPREILRVIALFRFALPAAGIGVYGGREVNLRDMQALIFQAGASGIMLGNYLTTPGRPAEADRQMLADLGLEIARPLDCGGTTPP